MSYPKLIENLIGRLCKLPGIGRRSAERIVFWLLDCPKEEAIGLSETIIKVKEGLRICRICNNLSETEICMVCSDSNRDDSILCVVETSKDLLAIERSGAFKGFYHVLLGNISPSDGRGPESINIQQLLNRIKTQNIKEVIIATDPDNEGEMTALYLTKHLKLLDLKVTRIGVGLPMGSSVEYSDISTLITSMNARREITA